MRKLVAVQLAHVDERGRIPECEPQQFADQGLVAHAVALDHIPVEHERGVFAEDQRTQGLLGEHHLRETTPPQILLERPAHDTLAVGVRPLPDDAPKLQNLGEAEREHLQGEAAAPKRGGEVTG